MSMSREEAIEFLLEHYNNPQYRGHVHDASFSKSGGNPGCSDIVEISARVADDGHIEDIAFEGQGCTISMAAADYVAEMAKGKSLAEIEAMTTEELIEELGREVVMTRPTCATTAFNVLKQAAHDYAMGRRAE
jgi:nitrogen fixation protein NifU and related proteins